MIPFLLGIDIGASKLALAVADSEGTLRGRRRRPIEASGDPERDLARIAGDAHELLRDCGVTADQLVGVGVAVPGPLDAGAGRVLDPPNLPGWRDVPVRDALSAALGAPVRIENDANAAALAEWRFGAGRGCDDLVYLTMSTGVGAGLILDGRLYRGAAGNAGEVGHLPVEWEGEPCACGRRGCLEAYVGGAAWTRRLRARAPADGRAAALAGGVEKLAPEHVLAAAREGDAFALAEVDRYNRYLARGVTALCFTLAPERVILGTIPSAAGEALCFAPLRELVAERVWGLLRRHLQIVPAGLGTALPDYAGLAVAREPAVLGDSG